MKPSHILQLIEMAGRGLTSCVAMFKLEHNKVGMWLTSIIAKKDHKQLEVHIIYIYSCYK